MYFLIKTKSIKESTYFKKSELLVQTFSKQDIFNNWN